MDPASSSGRAGTAPGGGAPEPGRRPNPYNVIDRYREQVPPGYFRSLFLPGEREARARSAPQAEDCMMCRTVGAGTCIVAGGAVLLRLTESKSRLHSVLLVGLGGGLVGLGVARALAP